MKQRIDWLCTIVIEFVFYSFIGWAYETILTSIVWGRFAERGWLHLPLCPIYGFCGLAILLVLHKVKSVPLIFIFGTLFTTAAELAASYILELFLDKPLWDYDSWALNFDGRIALGSSLIFGVLCVLLVKAFHPAARFVTDKMSSTAKRFTAAVMLGAIAVDAGLILTGVFS